MMGGDPGDAPGTEMEGRLGCSSLLCWNCCPTATCPADLICPFSTGSRAAPPTHSLSAWWVRADVSPVRSALTEQNFTSGSYVPKEKKGDPAPSSASKTTFNMKKRSGGVMDGKSNPISEVWRAVQRVVITLISSSVHGCLWSFQGRAERDRNHGSAMDDYLATPDQRFPSISSGDKEKSISATL